MIITTSIATKYVLNDLRLSLNLVEARLLGAVIMSIRTPFPYLLTNYDGLLPKFPAMWSFAKSFSGHHVLIPYPGCSEDTQTCEQPERPCHHPTNLPVPSKSTTTFLLFYIILRRQNTIPPSHHLLMAALQTSSLFVTSKHTITLPMPCTTLSSTFVAFYDQINLSQSI